MNQPLVVAGDSPAATSHSQTIFVSEYICSGAWSDDSLHCSLATEGRTMLLALLRNLLRPDGGFFRANLQEAGTRKSDHTPRSVSSPLLTPHPAPPTPHSPLVRTTWDDRLGEFPWSDFESEARDRLTVLPVARSNGASPETELNLFRREVATADAVFVIAPEFFGLLESRTHEVERLAPGHLIGCSSDAVRLCADKLALSEFLPTIGVPTIETHSFDPEQPVVDWPFPLVIKPRDGAGSTLTFRVDSDEQLTVVASQLRACNEGFTFVQQPFVPGTALSGAALVSRQRPSEASCATGAARASEASGTGRAGGTRQDGRTAARDSSIDSGRDVAVLPTGEQCLTDDGRFHYLGCGFPGAATQHDHLLTGQIIRRCCESIPGLGGYVGFDLIATSDGVRLVEINPRLTTSWATGRMPPAP